MNKKSSTFNMKKAIFYILVPILVIFVAKFLYSQYINSSPTTTLPSIEIEYTPGAELALYELQEIQKEIDRKNKNSEFPQTVATLEPRRIGIFSGKVIEEKYWCSDACPDNGIFFLAYQNIEAGECDLIGGYKVYKYGWGHQYLGCSPVKNEYSD